MPRPRKRHCKRPSTRRYLVLRHGRRLIKAEQDFQFAALADDQLAPGHEQLFSSNVPGLRAGSYTISVVQEIVPDKDSPDVNKSVPSQQKFTVFSPKFTIASDALYSVYPPESHSVRPEVLPHVVFNDATVPWERYGSYIAERTPPADYVYNRVPWVACLPFTTDELKLPPEALQGSKSLFRDTDSLKGGAEQTSSMAVSMAVADVFKLDSSQVATPFVSAQDTRDDVANLVFIKSMQFNSLFAKLDKQGAILSSSSPDVGRFRFLSHVRKVNTKGMADADEHDDETQTEREFGVTVSHRTGPLKIEEPVSLAAHLLSIEGVEQMQGFPIQQEYVALASLHSWNYMCLPPNSFNLAATFEALARTSGPLRPSVPELKPSIFGEPPDPIQTRVMTRIADGYSMVNYRAITGETSAALLRGPFTPTKVQYPQWDLLSNSGAGLQILDQQLGIMDITYSSAWQLGRTLAMADQPYSTALSRVRKAITDPALYKSQQQALEKRGSKLRDREQLIASLHATTRDLVLTSNPAECEGTSTVPALRWRVPRRTTPVLSYHSDEVGEFLEDNLVEQALKIASSPDKKDPAQPYGPPYDEYNTPYSADWVVVLRFVLDLSYLVNIPAQYLITDPSHVPIESFRFFHIDQNWVDALVDGALSIGNHIDPTDDRARRAIKQAINRYFSTPNSTLNYPPPVPRYGFYMRSAVVTKFPDLVLSTNPVADTAGTPILGRHDIIDTNLMLGLLNHEPVPKETFSLTFTQPAHQQSFTAAATLSDQDIKTSYSRIYTVPNPADPDRNKPIDDHLWKRGETSDRGSVFCWGTDNDSDDIRALHVENMALDLYTVLQTQLNKLDPNFFKEKIQTAAMMGIQLNDPCWQLQFEAPKTECPSGEVAMQLTYRTAKTLSLECSRSIADLQPTSHRIPTFQERALAPIFKPKFNPPHFQAVLDASILLPNDGTARDDGVSPLSNLQNTGGGLDSGGSSPVVVTPSSSPSSSPDTSPTHRCKTHELNDLASISLSNSWHFTKFRSTLSNDAMDGEGGAAPPVFKWKVAPASNPATSNISMLNYLQDLIISIVYQDNAADYLLTSMVISVPVGKPIDTPTLASSYRGPGCVMLSNLLFNVRTTYSDSTKMLQMVLLPRTTLGYVPVSHIRELSFLLRGVQTYNYPNGEKTILFTGQPFYKSVAKGEAAKFSAVLQPSPSLGLSLPSPSIGDDSFSTDA
ncbi:uncharacterized protein KY384_001265 [Bacidia gigantensis]|uniref:uncharacterized protein n=1 Tax=Bacidia gigantensis TaxID=2732470 RepID=UPI001D050D1D|nr:uncharacterized protein KY384_001265 [Bacidia gigantensis]KAG8533525.1 hypothetical protein KY384_001265 [Bacidia gigantensis]